MHITENTAAAVTLCRACRTETTPGSPSIQSPDGAGWACSQECSNKLEDEHLDAQNAVKAVFDGIIDGM